jgi:hypothetical protein
MPIAINLQGPTDAHNTNPTAHGLTSAISAALTGAASPSAGNVFATMADAGGSGGGLSAKSRWVACVLRSNAGTWEMINDSQHTPINVTSITQDGGTISINYAITAGKVITACVTADDTYAGKYTFGASAGLSSASVYCYRLSRHEHSTWLCTKTGSTPYFSVSNFAGAAMPVQAVAWNNGELAITHNAAEATTLEGNMVPDPMGYEVHIQTSRDTADYSHTYLKFYTLAGVQITDPVNFPVDFRFMFEKATISYIFTVLNPNVPELQLSNSNIWFLALVELP